MTSFKLREASHCNFSKNCNFAASVPQLCNILTTKMINWLGENGHKILEELISEIIGHTSILSHL